MEKVCKLCGDVFVTSDRNKVRQVYCGKKCQSKETQKRFREKNPDVVLKNRASWNSNWEKKTICNLKSKARKEGLPFNIDETDISLVETCPILGIKLDRVYGTEGKHVGYRSSSPSVDRIIPSLGYVKGNVRVISNRANLLKNNAELWEMERVLEDLRSVHKDFSG